jgi:hypothetical protein
MKTLEQTPDVVRYILAQNSAVAALVATRIRPNVAASGETFPYLIYNATSSLPYQTKDGTTDLKRVLVTVEIYTKGSGSVSGYDKLQELAAKVRQALDGQAGTIDGHDIQKIEYETSRNYYQEAGRIDGIYLMEQDFLIHAKTN